MWHAQSACSDPSNINPPQTLRPKPYPYPPPPSQSPAAAFETQCCKTTRQRARQTLCQVTALIVLLDKGSCRAIEGPSTDYLATVERLYRVRLVLESNGTQHGNEMETHGHTAVCLRIKASYCSASVSQLEANVVIPQLTW